MESEKSNIKRCNAETKDIKSPLGIFNQACDSRKTFKTANQSPSPLFQDRSEKRRKIRTRVKCDPGMFVGG